MIFSFDLLINAIVSGILIGAFYAAVTAGVSISFGILDIVNIAHPAFIILGSYVAYIVNASFGLDPIITASSRRRHSTRSARASIKSTMFRLRNAARNRCAVLRSSSVFCSSPK